VRFIESCICVCSSISLGWEVLVLGDRPSHLGECVSPKREIVRILCFCLSLPLRRGSFVLSDEASRLGEPSSPKRGIVVRWVLCLARHLGEVHWFKAKDGLAQARGSLLKQEFVGC